MAQLLVARGVRVLGIAPARIAAWLHDHRAAPVEYGSGLAEQLGRLASDGIDAFIDLFGADYLHVAAELGVPHGRTDTIVFSAAAHDLGIKMACAAALPDEDIPRVLTELAGMLASGQWELPIAATYPLDDVVTAFEELERRHTLGKIVLIPKWSLSKTWLVSDPGGRPGWRVYRTLAARTRTIVRWCRRDGCRYLALYLVFDHVAIECLWGSGIPVPAPLAVGDRRAARRRGFRRRDERVRPG